MLKSFEELKQECRKLRVGERLQSKEIAERLDLGSSTVSRWLADLPLTKEERSAIYSTNAKVATKALKARNAERGITDELRAECIRLRQEEGWSLTRFVREKALSKATLSYWFRNLPPRTERQKEMLRQQAPERKPWKRAVMPPSHMTARESAFYRSQHTATVGHVSEMFVRAHLAQRMWMTFVPGAESSQKTDLVATPGLHCRTIVRIQVKTLKWPKQGYPSINLRNSGAQTGPKKKTVRRYEPSDFDILIGYLPETNTSYILNWDDVGARKSSVVVKPEFANAWHKLDAFFSQEELEGQEAFWNSLASDTPDDQDIDEVE